MVKPIVLVVQPLHLDFPLWRYNMARFNKYFSSIWICFSNHYQEVDYSNFIRAHMPYANFHTYSGTWDDWRNGAINETLDLIKSNEPILFMEQDFLIKDSSFFEKVLSDSYNFLYVTEGDRVHPSFSLVKRDLIEQSGRDFAAHPDDKDQDHFGNFFNHLTTGINIDELGVQKKVDYYHLNGLSQNYHIYKSNGVRGDYTFYHPDTFLAYNYLCQQLPIETHPQFLQIEKQITAKFGEGGSSFMSNFFPGGDSNGN